MMAMALGSVQVAPFLYSNKGGRNRRARLSPRVETCPLAGRSPAPSAGMMIRGKTQRDVYTERRLSSPPWTG